MVDDEVSTQDRHTCESLDSLTHDLSEEGCGEFLYVKGSEFGYENVDSTQCSDGVSFSREDIGSCDLLSALWEQYQGTGESIVVPLPHMDLVYAKSLLTHTNEKKPTYTTNTSPLVDSIGTQLNDVWYNKFFLPLPIKQCISLHRTCEYIGALSVATIIVKHVAHQLNVCETNQNVFLGMV